MTIFTETTVCFELPREEKAHRKFVEQMDDEWFLSDYTTRSISYTHVTRVWSTPTEEERRTE